MDTGRDKEQTPGNLLAEIRPVLNIPAGKALTGSEAKYRTLIEGLPDIVMRFDRDGRHHFASTNVLAVTGLPAEAFIGKTHREMGFPESMCTFWEEAIRRVFDSAKPFETEFAFESPGGEIIFNWRLLPEMDAKATVQYVLPISRDITRHRNDFQNLSAPLRGQERRDS